MCPPTLAQRRLEGLAALGAERLDAPVLLRHERADLPLALDDEPERHGLHPPGREARLDAAPENGAGLVARPADRGCAAPAARRPSGRRSPPGRRSASRMASLVISWKRIAVGGRLALELVGDVPGDGLAFAIGVGGEDRWSDAVLAAFFKLGERLGLALDGDVLGLEVVLDVDAQLTGGEVAQVAHRGPHVVARAEILADGLGLRGRLDDHEGHALAPPAASAAFRPWRRSWPLPAALRGLGRLGRSRGRLAGGW